MKSGKSIIMSAILLFSIITTTIVYSAFNTELYINGDAFVRSDNEIRITGLEKMEYTAGVYEPYNNKYTKDTISIYVTLPANSSVTYEMEIINKSDVDYVVSKIDELAHNNSVSYTTSLKVDEDVIDYAASKSSATEKKFTIKISNNTSITQEEKLSLQFVFAELTYKASQLSYSNSLTSCKTAQCAIDELAVLLN